MENQCAEDEDYQCQQCNPNPRHSLALQKKKIKNSARVQDTSGLELLFLSLKIYNTPRTVPRYGHTITVNGQQNVALTSNFAAGASIAANGGFFDII